MTENHKEKSSWQKIIIDIIKELRLMKGSQPFDATTTHTMLLTASAVFCVLFDTVRSLEDHLISAKIPKEIGITDDESLGPKRVFRAIIDLVDHKKGQFKQRFADVAGLFPVIDIQNTMLLIQITIILFSSLEYYVNRNDSEALLYRILVEDGVLTIHKLNNLDSNAVIDFTQLKIINSFSD